MSAGTGRQRSASIKDVRSLQTQLDRTSRDLAAQGVEDVVIDNARRLLLRSPNGTYFAIGVTDAGVLTATNVGTSL